MKSTPHSAAPDSEPLALSCDWGTSGFRLRLVTAAAVSCRAAAETLGVAGRCRFGPAAALERAAALGQLRLRAQMKNG